MCLHVETVASLPSNLYAFNSFSLFCLIVLVRTSSPLGHRSGESTNTLLFSFAENIRRSVLNTVLAVAPSRMSFVRLRTSPLILSWITGLSFFKKSLNRFWVWQISCLHALKWSCHFYPFDKVNNMDFLRFNQHCIRRKSPMWSRYAVSFIYYGYCVKDFCIYVYKIYSSVIVFLCNIYLVFVPKGCWPQKHNNNISNVIAAFIFWTSLFKFGIFSSSNIW